MPFHPLAEIFPLPREDELRAMADDIADHGLREPIVTLEGQILDGRCRYLACKMAGVEPRFESHDGVEPIAYVMSRNFHRRHLTHRQRAMVAARLANFKLGANQHSKGVPIGGAAVKLNVSERSVARAKEIIRRGTGANSGGHLGRGEPPLRGATLSNGAERDQNELNSDDPSSSPALPAREAGLVSHASVDTPTQEPNPGPTLHR